MPCHSIGLLNGRSTVVQGFLTQQPQAKEFDMAECRKCHRPVHDCSACNGGRASGMFGKLTCSKCNNTGSTCNEHGGYWK